MSASIATQFLAKIVSDARYREVIEKAIEGESDQASTILALAAKEGMRFTGADLKQALGSFAGREGELSAADLATVAGGFNPQPDPPRLFNTLSQIFVRY